MLAKALIAAAAFLCATRALTLSTIPDEVIFPDHDQSFGNFGSSVSADPISRAVFVAAQDATIDGKLYLFENYASWTQTETILNPEKKLPIPYPNFFGATVSLNRKSLFVGAPLNRAPGNPEAGCVYVYARREHGRPEPTASPTQPMSESNDEQDSSEELNRLLDAPLPPLPVTQKLTLPQVKDGTKFGKALKSSENLLIVGGDSSYGDALTLIYKFNVDLNRYSRCRFLLFSFTF